MQIWRKIRDNELLVFTTRFFTNSSRTICISPLDYFPRRLELQK